MLWLGDFLLLLASAYSLNIATYNWFAADFHNQSSHAYAMRGNLFFFIAVALFGAFVGVAIILIRGRKRA
jgi:hypothetical protein